MGLRVKQGLGFELGPKAFLAFRASGCWVSKGLLAFRLRADEV